MGYYLAPLPGLTSASRTQRRLIPLSRCYDRGVLPRGSSRIGFGWS